MCLVQIHLKDISSLQIRLLPIWLKRVGTYPIVVNNRERYKKGTLCSYNIFINVKSLIPFADRRFKAKNNHTNTYESLSEYVNKYIHVN